jgi:hypothetical protein
MQRIDRVVRERIDPSHGASILHIGATQQTMQVGPPPTERVVQDLAGTREGCGVGFGVEEVP